MAIKEQQNTSTNKESPSPVAVTPRYSTHPFTWLFKEN